MSEIAAMKTHIINYSKTRDMYAAYRKTGYSKNSRPSMRVKYFCTKPPRSFLMNPG